MHRTLKLAFLTASIAGCSGVHHQPELRAALDEASLSLREAVPIAVTEAQASAAVRASLALTTPREFSVSAFAADHLQQVRIDTKSARVTSMQRSNLTQAPCPNSISLEDALAIAENAVGGAATASAPDDDDGCLFEIQVLVGDVLHEVKVGPDGAVLETELSDEINGGDGE